jgi:tetratricopeptide (TPR) repeat protein
VLLNIGKHAEAVADYDLALKLQPKDTGVLNNLAWVLATSPDDKLRDGRRAITLATQACELTDYKKPHILSTLGAAYAETGDFETAIKWSSKGIELGNAEEKEALGKEVETYRAGKPFREMLTEGKPAKAAAEKKPKPDAATEDSDKKAAAGEKSGPELPAVPAPAKKDAEK